MEKYYGVAMIAVICVLILFIGAMKQKAEILTTFVLRAFAGAVGIYAVNGMLKSQGLEVVPGVNPVTGLTVGTLGISGFALIYAIPYFTGCRTCIIILSNYLQMQVDGQRG